MVPRSILFKLRRAPRVDSLVACGFKYLLIIIASIILMWLLPQLHIVVFIMVVRGAYIVLFKA